MPRKRKAKPVKTPKRPADIPILPDDHVVIFGPSDDDGSGAGSSSVDSPPDERVAFVNGILFAAHWLHRDMERAVRLAGSFGFTPDDLAGHVARLRTFR